MNEPWMLTWAGKGDLEGTMPDVKAYLFFRWLKIHEKPWKEVKDEVISRAGQNTRGSWARSTRGQLGSARLGSFQFYHELS